MDQNRLEQWFHTFLDCTVYLKSAEDAAYNEIKHVAVILLLSVLQLQSLLPFQQVSPAENVIEEYGLKDADLPKQLFS